MVVEVAVVGIVVVEVVVMDVLVLGVVMVDNLILIVTNLIVPIVDGIAILERLIRI